MSLLADNRVARQRYFILETFVAGIALKGTEVKSIRNGQCQMRDAYVKMVAGRPVLVNCHISPYSHGNIENHEPTRSRPLLMKKSEIRRLIGKVEEKGLTMVPLKMFLMRGYIKVEVAVAKGKEERDKRDTIKKREADREIQRAIRGRG